MSESKKVRVLNVLIHVCGPGCQPQQESASTKVNSAAYVQQWQRIFGGKAKEAKA